MDFHGEKNNIDILTSNNDQPKSNESLENVDKNSAIIDSSKSILGLNESTSKTNDETQSYRSYYKASGFPKQLTEMFGTLKCVLCSVHVGSTMTAKAHYQGKAHMKKVKAYLIKWCNETGNPMPEMPIPRIHISETNLAKDRCSLCDVTFNSLADAEIHFSGKNHLKRLRNPDRPIKKRKIADVTDDPSSRFGIGVGFVADQVATKTESETKPKFFCGLCSVHAIDENQLKEHLDGSKHFKALKAKSSFVVPAPVNPADSILASVCRGDENLKAMSDYSMHRTPTGHYYCHTCNLTMNSEEQFTQHIESKKHKAKAACRKPQNYADKTLLTNK